VRKQTLNTFVDLNDGSTAERLQVVALTATVDKDVNFHSAVEVSGVLEASTHPGQQVELVADSVRCIRTCDLQHYPIQPRRRVSQDLVRQFPMYKAKTNYVSALIRLRNCMSQAIHGYFQTNDYLQVHTPILTDNDCEGAGEVFLVRPASDKICQAMKKRPSMSDSQAYFDKPVYLTVSGQLHLEAVCNGISRVYTFSPAFRAETGRTRRHLSEFSMVEAEIAFVDDLGEILRVIEELCKDTARAVLERCREDLAVFGNTDHIEEFVNRSFSTMTYKEAEDILTRPGVNLAPVKHGDLGREHELFLCQHTAGPVFVVDWPRRTKPFYMRRTGYDSELVSGVDLLVPGVGEVCGGALREHCAETLAENMAMMGKEGLDWYIDLRNRGAADTGGFGLGFERLVQYLLGIENIKDTLPFHRTPHSCKL